MEIYFLYSIKIFVFTGLLWFAYRFFISKNTFHQTNRTIILLIFGGSLFFPSLQIPLPEFLFFDTPTEQSSQALQVFLVEESTLTAETQKSNFIPYILGIGYLTGVLFFTIRYLIGVLSLLKIIRTAQKQSFFGKTPIYVTTEKVSPFSWFGYIVISQEDIKQENEDIIYHETVHVNNFHSVDALFAQLYCIVFWWNPFAWLLKRDLAAIHEYQADSHTILQSKNSNDYRKQMIYNAVGKHTFALAHNFYSNNLKNRILMTIKRPSTNKTKWNYITLICAVGFASLLSSSLLQAQEHTEKNDSIFNEITTSNIPDDVLFLIDEKPVKKEEVDKLNPEAIASVNIVKKAKTSSIHGEKAEKGIVNITTKKGQETKPLNSNQKDTIVVGNGKEVPNDVVFVVDGKTIEKNKIDNLDPETIESIRVFKGNEAKEKAKKYGIDQTAGVIEITTKNIKNNNVTQQSINKVEDVVFIDVNEERKVEKKNIYDDDTVFFINGKEVTKDEIETLDNTQIKSINIIKSGDSKAYGVEKGKKIIDITLK